MGVRAAMLVECGKPIEVEDVDVGAPGPGEAVVRLTASGVCHSDLTVARMSEHATPTILGHEGAGVVEAVGDHVDALRPGDRVISSFAPGCGQCWYCDHDLRRHCERTTEMWYTRRVRRHDGGPVYSFTGLGTFAEAMRVDARSVVKVETDLPDDALALIGCGVTTGVGAALNTGGQSG